LAKNAGAIA